MTLLRFDWVSESFMPKKYIGSPEKSTNKKKINLIKEMINELGKWVNNRHYHQVPNLT